MSRIANENQELITPANESALHTDLSTARVGSAPEWTFSIPDSEWHVYLSAIRAVGATGVRFMIGGAFGLAAYTGRWRNTKDLDFFVRPSDCDLAIHAVNSAGFEDYYETLPYDRGWIYRGVRDGTIVDIIWATPNRRTEVDDGWLDNAGRLRLRDEVVEVVPAEELLWIKLYVLQRDRCDWPDLINLLFATGATLDWDRLCWRLEDDLPLLRGLLIVYTWVCPERITDIPAGLRRKFGLPKPRSRPSGPSRRRIELLDSRPWFVAFQPADQAMRI